MSDLFGKQQNQSSQEKMKNLSYGSLNIPQSGLLKGIPCCCPIGSHLPDTKIFLVVGELLDDSGNSENHVVWPYLSILIKFAFQVGEVDLEMGLPDPRFREGFPPLLWGAWSAGSFQLSAAESNLTQPRPCLLEQSTSWLNEMVRKAWLSWLSHSLLAWLTALDQHYSLDFFVCPILFPSLSLPHTGDNCVCVCVVTQSRPTLCNPVDWGHQAPLSLRIFQARIVKWVAMPSFRGSSQPRDRTHVSHIAGRFFTIWTTREARGQLYWNIIHPFQVDS